MDGAVERLKIICNLIYTTATEILLQIILIDFLCLKGN